MPSEYAEIERIEAYVEGRMSDLERRAFEQRLAEDEALAKDLDAYRATRKALVDVFEEQQHQAEQKGKVFRLPNARTRTWKWAAAASVALIIGVGSWYFLPAETSLPELAERYAVHESPLPVLMSASKEHKNVLDKAMQSFGAERYMQAFFELEQLPASDTVAFYAALCEQALGTDPTVYFKEVIDRPNSAFRAKALYHLMLWQLRQGNRAEAQRLLEEQLSIGDHPYRTQLDALAASKALAH